MPHSLDFEGEPFEITQETAIGQVALLLEQDQAYASNPEVSDSRS